MVIDGIYREEISKFKSNKQIEYKFIPRNMYEDSIFFSPHKSTYEQLFEKTDRALLRLKCRNKHKKRVISCHFGII